MDTQPPAIPTREIAPPPESPRLARLTYALAWCREHAIEPLSVDVGFETTPRLSVTADDLLRLPGDPPVLVERVESNDPKLGTYVRASIKVDGLLLVAYPTDPAWLDGTIARAASWSVIGEAAERVERFAHAVEVQAGVLRSRAVQARGALDTEVRHRNAVALAGVDELTELQRLADQLTDACADAATVIADELGLDPKATIPPAPERVAGPTYRCSVPGCPGLPWSASGPQPHPCGSQVLGPDGWVSDERSRIATADSVRTPTDEIVDAYLDSVQDGRSVDLHRVS